MNKLGIKIVLFTMAAALFFPSVQIANTAPVDKTETNKIAALQNIVVNGDADPEELYKQQLEKSYRRTKRRKKIKYFALGTVLGLTGLGALVAGFVVYMITASLGH